MSEVRATPGPWVCVRKHPHVWAIDATGGDPDLGHVKWHSLADVYGCDDMGAAGATKAKANAHLIAAAPELYYALAELVKYAVDWDDEGLAEHSETIISARTALAKARGEKQ